MKFTVTVPPMKHSLLKIAAKMFDPIGCLTLFTMNLKILFQELSIDKVSWDQELQ